MKVVILALALFAVAFADIWSPCGTANDHFTISNVQITPDPPQIGQNLTVAATGTLDETVTSGSVYIEIAYEGITLLNNTYSLCTLLEQVGDNCPLGQGPVKISVREFIPNEAPPGDYTGQVVLNDQTGSQLTCIDLSFSLGSKKRILNKARFQN